MSIENKLLQIAPEISTQWDNEIIPELINYIKIPCKSPMFDPQWRQHGYLHAAIQQMQHWCQQQSIEGMSVELIEIDSLTPLLFIEIDGSNDDTILLYGHMDKQPEMSGWRKDLGPWIPKMEDGKLYGRGGADDGYAVYSALSAIAALQRHQIPHARCVILIEASEESGSPDLVPYIQRLTDRIGNPSLVIALDSECANYEQLWSSTSLRGIAGGTLTIETIKDGLHSGYSGGVVPSAFDILRVLLDRIEDANTGEVLVEECKVEIPQQRIDQAKAAAAIVGNDFPLSMDFVENTRALTSDVTELMLNRSWRPALAITGADGFPDIATAGNVMLPKIAVKLSMRLPPKVDPEIATKALKRILEDQPPYDAQVTFTADHSAAGWNAPHLSDWLAEANEKASQIFYGKPAAYLGIGGTIPFMAMLGDMFPEAQFLITGVLGPKSNAHGPNEFLHIDMVKKITGCVAAVIAYHFERE